MSLQIGTETREDCILSYHSFVCAIATRLKSRLPANVEREDLIASGMIGLIEAYDRFDDEKGIPFSTYAELRVRGAMIDMLRRQDWVPRSVRKRIQEVEAWKSWFHDEHGRKPNSKELAQLMGISQKQLERRMSRDQIHSLVSTEQVAKGTEDTRLGNLLVSTDIMLDQHLIEEEKESELTALIGVLPDNEKKAIEMYYQEGKSLREIGMVLGVTESRACQIRTKGIKTLRKKLRKFGAIH